jgi:hypothetical protein
MMLNMKPPRRPAAGGTGLSEVPQAGTASQKTAAPSPVRAAGPVDEHVLDHRHRHQSQPLLLD